MPVLAGYGLARPRNCSGWGLLGHGDPRSAAVSLDLDAIGLPCPPSL